MKLKAIIAGAAIIVGAIVTPVQADEATMICSAFSELAGDIMKNRQIGVDMGKMMGAVLDNETTSSITKAMVEDAYKTPRYSTDEFVKKAIQEFRNKVFLECYQSRTAQKK